MNIDLPTIIADAAKFESEFEAAIAPVQTIITDIGAIPFVGAIPGFGTALKDAQLAMAALAFFKSGLPKIAADLNALGTDLEAEYTAIKAQVTAA